MTVSAGPHTPRVDASWGSGRTHTVVLDGIFRDLDGPLLAHVEELQLRLNELSRVADAGFHGTRDTPRNHCFTRVLLLPRPVHCKGAEQIA